MNENWTKKSETDNGGFQLADQICEQVKRESLKITIREQNLRIIVEKVTDQPVRNLMLFEGNFTLIELKTKLQGYFESLEELKQYILGDISNRIKIDAQHNVLKVYAKVNTSKSKVIKIAEIELQKFIKNYSHQLQDIIVRCRLEDKLQQGEAKDMMAKIAQILSKQLCQHKNKSNNYRSGQSQNKRLESAQMEIKKQLQCTTRNLKKQYQTLKLEIMKTLQKNQEKSAQRERMKDFKGKSKQYQQIEKKITEKFQSQQTQISEDVLQVKKLFGSLQKKLIRIQKAFGSIGEQLINHANGEGELKQQRQGQEQILKDYIQGGSEESQSDSQEQKSLQQEEYPGEISLQDSENLQGWVSRGHKLIKPRHWFDQKSVGYHNIKFSENQVINISSTNPLFGRQIIKQIYEYSVKIISFRYYIGLGIIKSKLVNTQCLRNSKERFIYWSHGKLRAGKQKPFKVSRYHGKDTINIKVDFKRGFIQWRVNSILIKKVHSEQIQTHKCLWVPYIHLYGPTSILVSQLE